MIAPIAVFAAAFFVVAIRAAVKVRRGGPPRATREQNAVGKSGVVIRRIDPQGVVQIGAEQWTAESGGEPIAPGTHVQVVRMHGLRAVVEPVPEAPPTDEEPEPAPIRARRRNHVTQSFIGLAVVLVIAVLLLFYAIRIVREYQRLLVFRLGRWIGTKGPGLVILLPLIDRGVWVDLRELYIEIPHQTAITEDNASISIDFIIFYRVVDAVMSVIEVGNFAGAAQNIAATTLRSVVGDMSLDDVLAKREQMNEILRTKLDEVTERWGVKVTNVEVREIIPPPAVQEAMTRQMSAERTRRAVVTEADGAKQAAITVAEGNKQSTILNAEGDKQSAILRAEGERQSALLRAEGFANGLEAVFRVASTVDGKTMSLQYLEALKQLGASDSTKFVIPIEFVSLLAGVSNMARSSFTEGTASGG